MQFTSTASKLLLLTALTLSGCSATINGVIDDFNTTAKAVNTAKSNALNSITDGAERKRIEQLKKAFKDERENVLIPIAEMQTEKKLCYVYKQRQVKYSTPYNYSQNVVQAYLFQIELPQVDLRHPELTQVMQRMVAYVRQRNALEPTALIISAPTRAQAQALAALAASDVATQIEINQSMTTVGWISTGSSDRLL